MRGEGVVSKVVELFGGAAVELTRGVTAIGMALKAQVEMTEVLIDVFVGDRAGVRTRAARIVEDLLVSLEDLHTNKEEN